MNAEVCAAWINAGGTVAAALVVAASAWFGVVRELRARQRAEDRRELFVLAVRDCAAYISEIRAVLFELSRLDYAIVQREQERGLAVVRKVDEIWKAHGLAGVLIPPVLGHQKMLVDDELRAVRQNILAAANSSYNPITTDEQVNKAYEALDAFAAAFERWKRHHWKDADDASPAKPSGVAP